LYAVASDQAGDVWAVGQMLTGFSPSNNPISQPLIEHLQGSQWVIASSPNPSPGNYSTLEGVVVLSSANIWAAGYMTSNPSDSSSIRPLIEHYDGNSWQVVSLPSSAQGGLSSISGTSSALWSVGSPWAGALTMHYDGSAWSVVSGASSRFLAVTAISA